MNPDELGWKLRPTGEAEAMSAAGRKAAMARKMTDETLRCIMNNPHQEQFVRSAAADVVRERGR